MSVPLLAHPMPYPYGDSPAGVKVSAGKALGHDGNGKTCLAAAGSKTRVVVITHYSDWWKHGFEARPGTKVPKKPIEKLTLAQVKNLRSVKGHHPIMTGNQYVAHCKAAGLVPAIEMKPSTWTAAAVKSVIDYAASIGMPVVWTTIQTYGKTAVGKAAWQRKAFARMKLVRGIAGGRTMLLYRRPFSWAKWGPVLSSIKGHAGHGKTVGARTLLTALDKQVKAAKGSKPPPKAPPAPPRPPAGTRTPTADRVIAMAKSQIGYHEGRTGKNWNNHQKYSPAVPGLEWSQNQAWCATFVSWVALKALVAKLFPKTASTDTGARWFKDKNRWSEYPAIGAQGFLGTGNDMNHTFLVVKYDNTYIWTVEGNTNTTGSPQGDGVYGLKRERRSTRIRGYGYPAYPEGIVSADPAWANRAPKKG